MEPRVRYRRNVRPEAADTIVALASAYGEAGISVIRVSGPDALEIVSKVWRGVPLDGADSHTVHFGRVLDTDGTVLDEVVATVFLDPHSFTGEDVVEISCHGSMWIVRRLVALLIDAGARSAGPGEFTMRAYINGKLDLAQAESVADLISASSRAAHRLAISQMKGDYSRKLNGLRDQLIELASLLELELDFSEEDVEFADRTKLMSLSADTAAFAEHLAGSYAAGKVFKDGIPVVIAGVPNAGKSTLLNHLLGDDKAIVSDIAGTTRDIIEDTCEIDGLLYRFTDTAGLRETDDPIEKIGVERAINRLSTASIILWLVDPTQEMVPQVQDIAHRIKSLGGLSKNVILLTKTDMVVDVKQDVAYLTKEMRRQLSGDNEIKIDNDNDFDIVSRSDTVIDTGAGIGIDFEVIAVSAETGDGIDELTKKMGELSTRAYDPGREIIVTNQRHYESLKSVSEALKRVQAGLTDPSLPLEFIAQDLRSALSDLGLITGAIAPTDLLTTIFSRFCIGK